ncbi:MAG: hypothetical protein ACREOO_26870 [bacterium]
MAEFLRFLLIYILIFRDVNKQFLRIFFGIELQKLRRGAEFATDRSVAGDITPHPIAFTNEAN